MISSSQSSAEKEHDLILVVPDCCPLHIMLEGTVGEVLAADLSVGEHALHIMGVGLGSFEHLVPPPPQPPFLGRHLAVLVRRVAVAGSVEGRHRAEGVEVDQHVPEGLSTSDILHAGHVVKATLSHFLIHHLHVEERVTGSRDSFGDGV